MVGCEKTMHKQIKIALGLMVILAITFLQTYQTSKKETALSIGYEYKIKNSQGSNDSWSMFHGDLNHTGKVNVSPISTIKTWSFTTGGIFASPAISNGRIYIGSLDHYLYCLNETSGSVLWNFLTTNWIYSSPAISNDRVYFGSMDHNLYCIDAKTGLLNWSYGTGKGVYSSPAISNGNVYFGSLDHNIYCLNAQTSAFKWSYPTGNLVDSSPAVINDRIYIGSEDHYLYCLNATNGSLLWKFHSSNAIGSSPSISGNYLYIGSGNQVLCLNRLTGISIWNYTTHGEVFSTPGISSNRIFVGSEDNTFYCLDAISGASMWNYTTTNQIISSPSISGNYVFFGGYDGLIHCVAASTGEFLWSYMVDSMICSSPAIANGFVYIGGYNNFYCLPMLPIISAPYNLTAIGRLNLNQIAWQYKKSANWNYTVMSYDILRGMKPNHETYFQNIGNVTTWNDTSVIGGQIYYYKIRAISSLNFGNLSTEIKCVAGVPLIPNCNITRGDKNITITWFLQCNASIVGFRIYRGLSSSNLTIYKSFGNSTTSFMDSNVTNGNIYYYQVKAFNFAGLGNASVQVSARPCGIPSSPRDLQISSNSNKTKVILTWQAPSNDNGAPITGYYIYRNETLYATIGNETTFVDSNIASGLTYIYKIKAINLAGIGNSSIMVSISIPAASGDFNLFEFFIFIFASIFGIGLVAAISVKAKKNKVKTKNKAKNQANTYTETSESASRLTFNPIQLEEKPAPKLRQETPENKPQAMTPYEQQQLEQELKPQVDIKRCIVHKGSIIGANYSCPQCQVLYCIPCAITLMKNNEGCWNCGHKIDLGA